MQSVGALEQVQYLLGHSDARTTGLDNRTNKDVSRNIVERISIELDSMSSVYGWWKFVAIIQTALGAE